MSSPARAPSPLARLHAANAALNRFSRAAKRGEAWADAAAARRALDGRRSAKLAVLEREAETARRELRAAQHRLSAIEQNLRELRDGLPLERARARREVRS